MTEKKLGKLLQDTRENLKLSREQIKALTGVPVLRLERLEKGTAIPGLRHDEAVKLERVLKIELVSND